jgi:hypothetical protein
MEFDLEQEMEEDEYDPFHPEMKTTSIISDQTRAPCPCPSPSPSPSSSPSSPSPSLTESIIKPEDIDFLFQSLLGGGVIQEELILSSIPKETDAETIFVQEEPSIPKEIVKETEIFLPEKPKEEPIVSIPKEIVNDAETIFLQEEPILSIPKDTFKSVYKKEESKSVYKEKAISLPRKKLCTNANQYERGKTKQQHHPRQILLPTSPKNVLLQEQWQETWYQVLLEFILLQELKMNEEKKENAKAKKFQFVIARNLLLFDRIPEYVPNAITNIMCEFFVHMDYEINTIEKSKRKNGEKKILIDLQTIDSGSSLHEWVQEKKTNEFDIIIGFAFNAIELTQQFMFEFLAKPNPSLSLQKDFLYKTTNGLFQIPLATSNPLIMHIMQETECPFDEKKMNLIFYYKTRRFQMIFQEILQQLLSSSSYQIHEWKSIHQHIMTMPSQQQKQKLDERFYKRWRMITEDKIANWSSLFKDKLNSTKYIILFSIVVEQQKMKKKKE